MKELSIEEKAKAYDEAKLRMSKAFNDNRCSIGFMNEIFPELAESEDEKIRKVLINHYKGHGCLCGNNFRISYEDIRTWFEKQGEHANFLNKIQIGDKVTRNKDGMLVNLSQLDRVAKKDEKQDGQECTCQLNNLKSNIKFPFKAKVKSSGVIVTIHDGQLSHDGKDWIKYQSDAEDGYKVYDPNNLELVCEIKQNPAWSEEDKEKLDRIISLIHCYTGTVQEENELKTFLKSLKDRVLPQPKQGWSEEDIATISRVISTVKWAAYSDHSHPILNDKGATELIERLKSLKERYSWKPSEEQMEVLDMVLTNECMDDNIARILRELIGQLKKLREE